MKIRLSGKQRKRQGKNLVIMADKVSITVGGGKNLTIGGGTLGGVRGGGRKYHYSFDPNQPVTAVNSRQNQIEAPPPEEGGAPAPAEQSLVEGALGRLGTLLGGYAYDYARQALWRAGNDFLRPNGTYNQQTDPNEVEPPARLAPEPNTYDTVDDIFYVPGYMPSTEEVQEYYNPPSSIPPYSAPPYSPGTLPPYSPGGPPPPYGISGPGPFGNPSTNVASNATTPTRQTVTGTEPTGGLTPTVPTQDLINLALPVTTNLAPGQNVPAVFNDQARYRQRARARGLRINTSLARRLGSSSSSSPTPTTEELMEFMRTHKPKSGTPVPYGRK